MPAQQSQSALGETLLGVFHQTLRSGMARATQLSDEAVGRALLEACRRAVQERGNAIQALPDVLPLAPHFARWESSRRPRADVLALAYYVEAGCIYGALAARLRHPAEWGAASEAQARLRMAAFDTLTRNGAASPSPEDVAWLSGFMVGLSGAALPGWFFQVEFPAA